MSMFDRRDHYKPFAYPWAFEAFQEHEKMHWLASEVPLKEDVEDWKKKLTGQERNLLTQIFRMFTQMDADVGAAYYEKYIPRLPVPELRLMMGSFANREGTHQEAYSLLVDTVGMPEIEYQAFQQYTAMKEKHEYLFEHRELLEDIAVFSAFGEGLQLFASFVILMSFRRRGLMKGMCNIVEWSIRDESAHVAGMLKVFHALKQEQGVSTISGLDSICVKMVDLEDKFIELAFEQGDIEGLTALEVKEYIRYVADRRLVQLGEKPLYLVTKNPLPWMDAMVAFPTHTNFFEARVTDYTKAAGTGSFDGGY